MKRNYRTRYIPGTELKVSFEGGVKTKKFPLAGKRRCAKCGNIPLVGEFTWVVTEQTSWFRGEDKVYGMCESCAEKELEELSRNKNGVPYKEEKNDK